MKKSEYETSIGTNLQYLIDNAVSEPERRKAAERAKRRLIHASKVKDVKGLRKAVNDVLKILLDG